MKHFINPNYYSKTYYFVLDIFDYITYNKQGKSEQNVFYAFYSLSISFNWRINTITFEASQSFI